MKGVINILINCYYYATIIIATFLLYLYCKYFFLSLACYVTTLEYSGLMTHDTAAIGGSLLVVDGIILIIPCYSSHSFVISSLVNH